MILGDEMKRSAIIIGAGIGGLAAAARLLKMGYDVKIIEKNPCCGGKTSMLKAGGFTFDLTATIMMMPDEYMGLSEELGLDLNFIKLEPNYRVNFFDGAGLDFYTDIASTLEQIEKINDYDGKGYLNFLSEGYKKYQIAYNYFLNKNFDSIKDLISSSTIKGLVQGFPLTFSYHYISKFIKDKRIRAYLAFQTMYIGVDPMRSSDMYTLIPVISAVKGLWYLKGGMSSFVLALEEYIRKNGGTICLNTTCEKLISREDHIESVVTNQGVFTADVVICNSDYSYSQKTYFNNSKQNEGVKGRKFDYSCSVFILYLGLRKKYEGLSVHNIYIGEKFKKNVEAAFKGKLPLDPPLYIYCPSKIDSTMAPEGKDAINVMVRVPNLKQKQINWNEKQVKKMRDRLIQSLRKVSGLEDIEDNIEFESYLTPTDLETRFNSSYGNAFGISHILTQTAFLRPQIKSRDFTNLYFIGDSVHPGTGVSLVLLGSKLLCEHLRKSVFFRKGDSF